MMRRIAAAAAVTLGGIASSALAEPFTIIFDRQDRAVELFLSLPADAAEPVFGLSPDTLTDESGTVPFELLRQGTFEIADVMFAGVDAQMNGAPLIFEGLSLMVHPVGTDLNYTTPFDGLMATIVCTAPEPDTPPTLDVLQLYTGYIAYTDTPGGVVTLRMPELAHAASQTALVRHFDNGVARGEEVVVLQPGGVVTLAPMAAQSIIWLWAVGALTGIGMAVLGVVFLRRGARPLTA